MFPKSARVSFLKLAGVGAIAVAALAAAPTSRAARVSTAHARTMPDSTISVTPATVTSGATVAITGNGPRNTHAGVWITLRSEAFASKTSVNGIPSIRTQVLVNGRYSVKATLRRGLKPTTYAVVGSYNGHDFAQVAWLHVLGG